jgi:NAD(P)-dependent dehydrogenase (short-subunit alcohol dehydrogenase family)
LTELAGKIAIVTGGASGIGKSTVQLFVKEGARVVIADLDEKKGGALVHRLGNAVAFIRTNVADANDVQRMVDFAVDRFGGLNVLFNYAGIQGSFYPGLEEDDFADFQQVMAVNLLGVMLCTQRAARHMAKAGGGSIINIGSIGGVHPGLGVVAYRMSKAAVNHFTKCMAIDLGRKHGIRVNAINPHAIPTEMTTAMPGLSFEASQRLSDELNDVLAAGQLLRRRASATDVGNAAVYFASDRSANITGQVIQVDAGYGVGDPQNYTVQIAEIRKKYFPE